MRKSVLSLVALIGLLVHGVSLSADTINWNLAVNGDWDTTTANWTPDVGGRNDSLYVDGDFVTFGNTAGGTVNLTADRAPGSTTINAASGTYIFSGSNLTSGNINKSGNGIATLNSSYTGTGAVSVTGGTLEWGNSYSGAANFNVTGTLRVTSGATLSLANNVTGTGTLSTTGAGSTILLTASNQIADTLRVTGSSTLNMAGFDDAFRWASSNYSITNVGNLTLGGTGVIDRTGGVISGSGSVTFGTDHTGQSIINLTQLYTGGTIIDNGQVSLYGGSGHLPATGQVTVNGSGIFSMNYHNSAGQTKTIGALNGNGSVLSSNNNTGNTIFRVGNGDGSGDFSGVFSGAGSLFKMGTGTQILSGTNTYTGTTTVSAGKLLVNGVTGSGQNNYSIQSGATLGGNGVINLDSGKIVNVLSGGILEPGNSPGTLTINGGLTLNDGSVLNMEGGDSIVVNGVLTGSTSAGGITLNLLGGPNGAFVLLDWTGGSVTGLELSDFAVVGGSFNYLSIEGSQLLYTVPIPEPSSLGLLGLGVFGLIRTSRRRKTRPTV